MPGFLTGRVSPEFCVGRTLALNTTTMDQNPPREFGTTAKSLSRNPLGIIALFIVLVYGLACLVVITGGSLSPSERLPIIYFLILFPFVVLGVFTYLVAFRAGQLFAPSDFRKEDTYLELQKMRLSAVALSLLRSRRRNRTGAALLTSKLRMLWEALRAP